MEDPRYSYLKVVKMILRYVKETENFKLFYQNTYVFELTDYVNSYWFDDIDDCKSTSGYALYIGGTIFT
jgi:hypothetical protein